MFRRFWEEHADLLLKKLHSHCGAKSLSDLKTIVLDSLPMSSSMVCQPNSAISGLLGGIKAAFCNESSNQTLHNIMALVFLEQ